MEILRWIYKVKIQHYVANKKHTLKEEGGGFKRLDSNNGRIYAKTNEPKEGKSGHFNSKLS